MSPITSLSEIVRMPRIGKIRLGVKVVSEKKGTEYPKATDYFVVPDEVKKVFGDKPKELKIMFPVEDVEAFAQQWLRAYSLSQGLVCKGDGVTADRKIDVESGAIADSQTNQWERHEVTCNPQECPEYQGLRCRRVMNLQFLLPDVEGLGVWQIDTTSFYSIVNINSMVKLLRGMLGRCSMIPLTLALGPVEVSPIGIKKKTVFIMHIKTDFRIAELAKIAQLPPAAALLPPPDEEMPDDLYSEEKLAEREREPIKPLARKPRTKKASEEETKAWDEMNKPSETPETPETTPVEAPKPPAPAPAPAKPRDPKTITDINSLYRACNEDFGLQPGQVLKELGYRTQMDFNEKPTDAYLRIKAVYEGPK